MLFGLGDPDPPPPPPQVDKGVDDAKFVSLPVEPLVPGAGDLPPDPPPPTVTVTLDAGSG
jgi:hypothetical protein